MTESVSVAIATFNGARYIEEQLRSILEQEHRPDEIVVSDGGSTDDTLDIVRRVLSGRSLPLTRIIADGSRLAVTANFERAIRATSGDLIALSDQDDVWHPDRVGRAVAAFVDERVLLSHANARLVDADGADLGPTLFDALGIRASDLEQLAGADAFALLLRRNLATGATMMMSRRLLGPALPFPSSWVHDEWLATIASTFGRLSPDPTPLIDYRQHGANAIGVAAPTLRYRVHRMLEPRGDRYMRLAARARILADRLDALDAAPPWRELARRKDRFEAARSVYPGRRLARIPQVLSRVRVGDYRDLSSQRDLDILRDILQPA